MRTRGLFVTTAAALLLAGCGKEERRPQDDVRAAVTRFGEATVKKDYQVICDELLAPALVKNVEQYGLPCELALKQGLGEVKRPKLTIGAITVEGDRATARVTTAAQGQKGSTDDLALRLVADEWRIAALGS